MVRRHLLLALGALVVVVLVLENTSQFRNAQFGAIA
jgi:branched-chain amino acid transport system permease protein